MSSGVSSAVGETNISILSKIFKKDIVLGTTGLEGNNKLDATAAAATNITEKYITTPWFNDLFLVFMYLEKTDDSKTNTTFTVGSNPADVDTRRTLYYAKFMTDKMELLSNKGFTTDNFVKVRALVEKVRTAATTTTPAADIIAFLNELNNDFTDILTDVATNTVPTTGTYNAKNEIFGGKHNKSSKQRKQKKNKGSRKH